MSNPAIKLAVVAGVVGGAVVVSSWWFGEELETQFRAGLEGLRAQSGYHIVLERYDRGLFTSEVETSFEIPAPADGDATSQDGEPATPLRLRMRHSIAHGPGLDGLRSGRMLSTPIFEGEALVFVRQAFGSRAAFTVRTDFGFASNAVVFVESPPVETTLPGKEGPPAKLQWSGLEATFEVQGARVKGRLFAPGLLVTSEDLNLGIGAALLTTDARHLGEGPVWLGDSRLTVASVELTMPTARMHLMRLAIDSDVSEEEDGLIRNGSTMSAERLELLGSSIERPLLKTTLDHLDAEALSKISVGLRHFDPAKGPEATALENFSAALAPLRPEVAALVKRKPGFRIDELSFRGPQGLLRFDAELRYVGDAEVLDLAPADLEGHATLEMPLELLDSFSEIVALREMSSAAEELGMPLPKDARARAEAAARENRLQLTTKKLADIDGDRLRTRIDFEGGKLRVNGRDFDELGPGLSMLPGQAT